VLAARRIVQRALEHRIRQLTLYAFSSDNWRRPAAEVQGIFGLLRVYLRKEVESLREHGVRLQIIGRRDRLARDVLKEIEEAEAKTTGGRRLRLCIAIDYSSRNTIARVAATALSTAKHVALGEDRVHRLLTEAMARDGSDVDLLIRTGGEKRLSDFLLWESAYAELIFTDRMWPEFDEHDFDAALEEFTRRERRFGAVPAALSPVSSGT
jgi:undecaprenyl diphosphate synthase